MRKILFLFAIILSLPLMAQHPDLQQGRWYVQSLTIDGDTTDIPFDPVELPFVYILFYNSSGMTASESAHSFFENNCNAGFTGFVEFSGSDIFEFTDFDIFQNFSDCSTDIVDFLNMYIDFYQDEITEQFTYDITTETDNTKTLTVTNHHGDTAVYTDTFFNPAPQEISDNDWYLHLLTIDGNENVPPGNSEISSVVLSLHSGESGFGTSVCSYLIGNPYFDSSNASFYVYDVITTCWMDSCSPEYPENNAFTELYIEEFYLNNLPGPFSYELTSEGTVETLTVTDVSGNQAFYRNVPLSVPEYTGSSMSFYPNPVQDVLYIENTGEVIRRITIYDILGKAICTEEKTFDQLNLSGLKSGVFFVKAETVDGVIVKRIVKE